MENHNSFLAAYIAALLTTALPEGSYNPNDLAPETRALIEADCRAFWDAHGAAIEALVDPVGPSDISVSQADLDTDRINAAHAGNDFWLSRSGYGEGFREGRWPEPLATILHEAAQAFGERNYFVGPDGLIYPD